MTSASTWKSLTERSPRQHIACLVDPWLLVRCPATQGVEADAFRLEVHFGSDQAMLPQGIHGEAPAQQLHLSLRVAAPQEDQPPLRVSLQVQPPVRREGTTCRCRLDPRGRTLPMRGHIAGRPVLQPFQGGVLEACPDLGLPQTVEALDGCLETGLTRGNKHGDHTQTQAGPRDAADRIGMDLGPLEDGVVVELRVAGQAEGTPVLDQGFDYERRGNHRARPGSDQAAVQGDAIEDLNLDAAADDQPLDTVDAVQFGAPVGDRWQVPARRWRRATGPTTTVQSPTPLQDQAD